MSLYHMICQQEVVGISWGYLCGTSLGVKKNFKEEFEHLTQQYQLCATFPLFVYLFI